MAFMTQGLKVCFIPHENRIASVWFDVVNVSRQLDNSLLLTLYAEWMSLEDSSTKALPLVAITSSSRATCAFCSVRFTLSFHLSVSSTAFLPMQITVFLSKRYRLATAGILANG